MGIQGEFKSFLNLVVYSAAMDCKWQMSEFVSEELK
jgi:hypothetical protein